MNKAEIPVTVRTGNYEVIASGVVHTNGSDISFDLAGLKVNFIFSNDVGGTRFHGAINENTLTITLYNFNNTLGEGKLDPVEIGMIGGRSLYTTWVVNTIENQLRQFSYTFLLKDK
jgi:hypothetical protein